MLRIAAQNLPEEIIDRIIAELATHMSKSQLFRLLTLSRAYHSTVERNLYRDLTLANSDQAAVQSIASALQASPQRGNYIGGIEFKVDHQIDNVVQDSPYATFLWPVMEIFKRCQPFKVSVRANAYHEETWNSLKTDRIEDLAISCDDWESDDYTSRWMSIIARSSNTLKRLHLTSIMNDLDPTSPLFPQPSTFSFPELRYLHVSHWAYTDEDIVHSSTILGSRDLSPFISGIVECAGAKFEEIYFDKTASHRLILEALLKKGAKLKKLGSLNLDQIPGTGIPVQGEVEVVAIDNGGHEGETIVPVPPQTDHTLASLTPSLLQLSVRGIPAEHLETVVKTFPESLEVLRIWLGHEEQQEVFTALVQGRQVMRGLRQLDVELRTSGRIPQSGLTEAWKPMSASFQRLLKACECQSLKVNIVEPLRHWYD